MANKMKQDLLCKNYAEAIAFFEKNMETLDEQIRRRQQEKRDASDLEKAQKRLCFAREGVSRMLSDRAQALNAAEIDVSEVLGELAAMQNDTGNKAIALIVRQRERLTNTDRGRRALQRKMGKIKYHMRVLEARYNEAVRNNDQLRQALAPMISEREGMMLEHAKHHCKVNACEGCPFEKHCLDDSVSSETRHEWQKRMKAQLLPGARASK